MRDLSLHVLDLVENALRAGASIVEVGVEEDAAADRLVLSVEDNGPGFPPGVCDAADPFFTTKSGHRTGLGLSLLRAAAERAEGKLLLGRSGLGGAAVRAEMSLGHVDRSPLGDMAASLSSVVCTNPGVDLRCRITSCDATREVTVRGATGLVAARDLAGRIRAALAELAVAP